MSVSILQLKLSMNRFIHGDNKGPQKNQEQCERFVPSENIHSHNNGGDGGDNRLQVHVNTDNRCVNGSHTQWN